LDNAASNVGLDEVRTLLQLRVRLPLPERAADQVDVRSFRPGVDEQAWLEVNNAAFQWHAEQGGWDLEALEQREREPWFDPDGFLLYERDARVAAFCWTKIHHDTAPVLGEIYVIAVHPDFHGLGLGRALTAAGLQHLAGRGIQTGMLYVDGTNTAAVSLYQSMGFAVHRIDRAHVGIVPPTLAAAPV
ncbi:MAG: acetyltransferase MshD, partial [Actinomycetota bacterium]